MDMNFPHEPLVLQDGAPRNAPRTLRRISHDILLSLVFDSAMAAPGQPSIARVSANLGSATEHRIKQFAGALPKGIRSRFINHAQRPLSSNRADHPPTNRPRGYRRDNSYRGCFDDDAAAQIHALSATEKWGKLSVYHSPSAYFKAEGRYD